MISFNLAIAAALLAAPGAEGGTPAVEAPCELHVWPGSGLGSVYNGLFRGGLVNGAVNGRDGYAAIPSEPISTQNQVELLTKAAPQHLLGRPDYRLIVHGEALPSRTIRTSTTRIDGSSAACYAELIVDDVFFQQDMIDGSYLKILFRYRDFGPDPLPRRVFGTWVKTKLKLLPPKPGADLTAAGDELRAAFSNDVKLFVTALLKPPKPKR